MLEIAVQKLDGKMRYSAKDIVAWTYCQHLTKLEHRVAGKLIERPKREDPELDFLSNRGLEHEAQVLAKYRDQGLSIAEIDVEDKTEEGIANAAQQTKDAMAAGADIIYQATFVTCLWLGYADFLRKVESPDTPSVFGNYYYEPIDAKLARHVRVAALVQLALYAELLTDIQHVEPTNLHVALGDKTEFAFPYRDIKWYFKALRNRVLTDYDEYDDSAPLGVADPTSHCKLCAWVDVCDSERREADHLSLVSGLGHDHLRKLHAAGINTSAELAVATELPAAVTSTIRPATLNKLQTQARLQLDTRKTGKYNYELLPFEPGRGLAQLPTPDSGDLFFDFEGDPFIEPNGREYLVGIVEIDDEPMYRCWWAHSAAEEQTALESTIDYFIARCAEFPNFHIYHYASYEVDTLKRLCATYGTREHELDTLLRSERFVDLYRVVRQSLRTSTETQSIKEIEHFYMEARQTEVKGGAQSVYEYERWLDTGDANILEEIRLYNEDDCQSTYLLRNWLEERRDELTQNAGEIERPAAKEPEIDEALAQIEAETEELVAQLCRNIPADREKRNTEQQTQWLLAQLLGWHRREDNPAWWFYFERLKFNDDDFFFDTNCLAGLTFVDKVGAIARSGIYRYKFTPQEHRMDIGKNGVDPETKKEYEVVDIDNAAGTIDVKQGPSAAEVRPLNLIPPGAVNTNAMRGALRRVASDVLESGWENTKYRASRDLILKNSPRLTGTTLAELSSSTADASTRAREAANQLDASVLSVQGPPGTGKTYTAAQLAIDLVASGKKIGITAPSHKAISNLLDEILRQAESRSVTVRIAQKSGETTESSGNDEVTFVKDNPTARNAIDNGCQIVAGTSWLFARDEWDGVLDTLLIDEASQFSLANAIAVSTAAKNLVLFGDPQQLSQPMKGKHPDGAEVSALGHVIGDVPVIPSDRGVFLDVTRRMHPDVCAVVSEISYNNELHSLDECANQGVESTQFERAGVHFVPVEHEGNRVKSPEEAEVVSQLVNDLLGGQVIAKDKTSRNLTVEDILVVAPYNSQVACLKELLPDGVQIGTVDKFQGRESAVVIYSMAASSPENITRGIDFLYDTHRLNVAISRAKCLAIVVANPALVTPAAVKLKQLAPINAFCHVTQSPYP